MIPFAIVAVQLLTITPPLGEPRVSADVVPAWISRGSLADGRGTAHEGETAITVWLLGDETMNARSRAARVKVITTDGNRQLRESVIRAVERSDYGGGPP